MSTKLRPLQYSRMPLITGEEVMVKSIALGVPESCFIGVSCVAFYWQESAFPNIPILQMEDVARASLLPIELLGF